MALVLLGTQACHLCENAQALLMPFQEQLKVDIFLEDIAQSVEQVERYGLRIPVLLHEESQDELGWPFDSNQLYLWLKQHNCLHLSMS